ncbi:hypothetical protein GA0004734_00000230 [Rhizobium sp. 9140]|nr:hypothetical protein GA0004734_00000230 [Rhizobium sp. 9140]
MPGGSYIVNEKGEEVLVERTLSVEEAAEIAAAETAAAERASPEPATTDGPAAPEASPVTEAPAEPEASTRRGKREAV